MQLQLSGNEYFSAYFADIPPRLREAKKRARKARAEEAERLGVDVYELDPDHLWPEYWEHVALVRAAQWRSIRNCYEQDEGLRSRRRTCYTRVKTSAGPLKGSSPPLQHTAGSASSQWSTPSGVCVWGGGVPVCP
jgi:hypothetical protein